MTYSSLLSAIYGDFERLWMLWNSEVEKAGDIGVFAYFPDDYTIAASLADIRHSFWRIDQVRSYLSDGEPSSEGIESIVDDVSVADEFLVMIVEYVGGTRQHAVHIHRITKFGIN